MELFIESPQRVQERLERERRVLAARQVHAVESLDLDEPDMTDGASGATPEVGSGAAEVYQAERAYDRRRARRRKLGHALRLLGIVIAVPLAVAAMFFASYALTYILNGATPEEVAQALLELIEQGKTVLQQLLSTHIA